MRKHHFFLLGTACMCATALHAQNWVNGGNTLTADGRLGTNNAFALIFETNNTERGRITNGGIWSIGTTPKTAKFTVNSVAGQHSLRAMVAEATKLIVNSNGGTTIGGGTTVGPANGLYVSGSVGIGTSNPVNKLHVAGDGLFTQGLSVTNGGILGISTNGVGVIGEGTTYGLHGTGTNTGVLGRSTSGGHGVDGWSSYLGVYGNGGSYGVYGASNNTGVYGSGTTYGTYGNSASGIGVVGNSTNYLGGFFYSANSYGLRARTGLTSKNWAGVFDGNVIAYGIYQTSDQKLKKNIEDCTDALSIINKLKPRSYEFRKEEKLAFLNLPQGKHYGLIAQELEEILPDLVMEVDNDLPPTLDNRPQFPAAPGEKTVSGTETHTTQQTKSTEKMTVKAVNYTELIPLLIKALQEQQQQINELKRTITQLTQTSNTNLSNVIISKGVALLEQNHPNPVKESTNIRYSLPQGFNGAQLLITDSNGRQVKTIQLATSGVVHIDAAALNSGVYHYSLVVDNKTIDTKRLTVIK